MRHQGYSTMRCEAHLVQAAVVSICPEIQLRVSSATPVSSERALWWELSSCILSSQVPYSLATAAADALDHKGLLYNQVRHDQIEELIFNVLSKPLSVEGTRRKYRFPAAKAGQLATTYQRIRNEADCLVNLLDRFATAPEARRWLIENAPGLGPKQASMFLRNIGVSYDLAILDRHVLDYMELVGLRAPRARTVLSLPSYIDTEDLLRDHAADTQCPVGILDWAIWIVMRVVKQREENLA